MKKEQRSINYLPLFNIGVISVICGFVKHAFSQNEPNFLFCKIAVSHFLSNTFAFFLFPFALKSNPLRTQYEADSNPTKAKRSTALLNLQQRSAIAGFGYVPLRHQKRRKTKRTQFCAGQATGATQKI
ncbi:MAG: hypothetical protein MUD09_04620 [Desulfobacterales bacterium]|nr:hypothetical protein [Desulfobacterales bacterium]